MKKIYKSKVAKWYIGLCILLAAAFIGTIFLCYNLMWILIIDVVMMGICVLMVFDMLLHTDYTINGEKLHIRCGILFQMDLPISKIIEITHKSTILSSPALSSKRIGLKYGKRNWVYVSPQHQEDFISTLKSINPEIIIK